MSIVKLDAFNALRCAIAAAVPALDGKQCIGIGLPGHKLTFPSLAIVPASFGYRPYEAAELDSALPDRVAMDVGLHEVAVQLRLVAATAQQRYELEDAVLELFLSQPLRPGVLLTPVSACDVLGTFKAAWILDDHRWGDALAFDNLHESIINVTGEIPAIVTRLDAYRINDLRLGLTHDIGAAVPAPFVTSSTIEVISVQADGSAAAVI